MPIIQRDPIPDKDRAIIDVWDKVVADYKATYKPESIPALKITDTHLGAKVAHHTINHKGEPLILVNSNIPTPRLNFVIAHEIGHHHLKHSKNYNSAYTPITGGTALAGCAAIFFTWALLCKKSGEATAKITKTKPSPPLLSTFPVVLVAAFGYLFAHSYIVNKPKRDNELEADEFARKLTSPQDAINTFSWYGEVRQSSEPTLDGVLHRVANGVNNHGELFGTTHPSAQKRLEISRQVAEEEAHKER